MLNVERPYVAHVKSPRGDYDTSCTRDEWLTLIHEGRIRPKPPEYWLEQQEQEGRSRKQASIVWVRHYSAARKYVIWDMAEDRDFLIAGYRR